MTEEFVSSAEIRDEMRKELMILRAEVIKLIKERDDLKDALNHADDMVCMYAPEGPLLETYKDHVHAVMDGEPSPLRAELTAMAERNGALEEALKLAKDSHGTTLLTDPPQDAWKARMVDQVIEKILRGDYS